MFGGWLTSELAPHLLAATVADAALHLPSARRDPKAVALAAGTIAGLGALIVQSERAKGHVDDALREALGPGYLDQLRALYTDDLDLATPLGQLAMPFRMHNPQVEITKDVVYADHGRRGLLDVYRPRNADLEDAPVLLQVHGGGWTIGNKDQQGIPLMLHMAARGWVCIAINYRLSPRARFPDHIVDVKRGIAWIRGHAAEYGGDPSYIAVTGGSAGGHLAALAALTPNDPEYQPGFEDVDTSLQMAVPFYGVYDFAGTSGRSSEQMRDRFLARRVMFKDPRTDLEAFERASPLHRVSGSKPPPFFVVHGRHDSLVGVGQARELVRRLRAVSDNPVAYAELPGTQHAFDVFPSIRSAHVVRGVDRFLRWNHSRAVDAAAMRTTA